MNTRKIPERLVLDLLHRSTCSVQVAAVLCDDRGIFAWGWNSVGSGYGEHAEAAALRRANPKRIAGSICYVASVRKRNGKIVTARPCPACQRLLRRVGKVLYRDGEGVWRPLQ